MGDGDQWPELIFSALKHSTPFILVARDVLNLLEGDEWVNLRRSLRLLQDSSISVVAGASRDSYFCFCHNTCNIQLKMMTRFRELGPEGARNRDHATLFIYHTSISQLVSPSRNSTGHWRANCYQSDVHNFNLFLKPGYERSECDCMRCDVAANAPFVIRASALSDHVPLTSSSSSSLESAEGMFTKLFLGLKYAGYTVCK